MVRGLLGGLAAGAAGTTALNAATYLDMAIRGRGTSSAPQDLVEAAAKKAGVSIAGQGDERDRLAGLGPLSGIAVGVTVGAIAGAAHSAMRKRASSLPASVTIALISAAAMAMSDVPLTVFGISDPADWTIKDWAADAVPHLVFGAVTYSTLRATDQRMNPTVTWASRRPGLSRLGGRAQPM